MPPPRSSSPRLARSRPTSPGRGFVPWAAALCFLLGTVRLGQASSSSSSAADVNLAGIFDLSSTVRYAQYIRHHFTLAVDLINNHTDGFWDDVLTDAQIKTNLANAQCSERKGASAYWSMREWGQPLHGVIGCRCSGASMAVAAIAQLEQIPQISFSSTSPRLSDKEDFPYFFRTVTPDGPKGGVGAMVQLMRTFGWERTMVLRE
jgi:ABC-type branched-subunit amino acid transport system substrate-binding protein